MTISSAETSGRRFPPDTIQGFFNALGLLPLSRSERGRSPRAWESEATVAAGG